MLGEKQSKQYNIMLFILFVCCVVIYAIHIVQYPDGLDGPNIAEATIECLILMGTMLYNYKIISSYLVGTVAGLIGAIYKVFNWEFILFFSFFGLLISIIRVLHKQSIGEIQLPEKPKDRVEYLINLKKIKPINIDHLYRAMLIVIMATVVMNIKNNYNIGDSFGSPDYFSCFILMIPLFLGFLYGMSTIDALIFGFLAAGAETMVCLQYYTIELDLVIMYQATIKIITMFICAYSYWFGFNQLEEE